MKKNIDFNKIMPFIYDENKGVISHDLYGNKATNYSFAIGLSTNASGFCSFADGYLTEASGSYSHAEGYGTIAQCQNETVVGKYNSPFSRGALFTIGCGTSDSDRQNALYITENGSIWLDKKDNLELTENGKKYFGSSVFIFPLQYRLTQMANYIADLLVATKTTPTMSMSDNTVVEHTGGGI